jgi:hypothetical protein
VRLGPQSDHGTSLRKSDAVAAKTFVLKPTDSISSPSMLHHGAGSSVPAGEVGDALVL